MQYQEYKAKQTDANQEKARNETNQMFADQGHVLWNSTVNTAEGTINLGLDAIGLQGGQNPLYHLNPSRPQVDFSSVKSDYRSEMMRRDLHGKVGGDGIKAGQAIETGVTITAPFVVGAVTVPKAVPQSLKSPGGIPKVETPLISSRITGARELSSYDFDGAEKVYNQIRATETDVANIAKNTGISESKIARIKDHLFNQKHILDDGLRIFDADPEIANAWNRLEKGNFTGKDLQLLEHDYFESRFEKLFRTNYRTSHDAANRSGRKSGLE